MPRAAHKAGADTGLASVRAVDRAIAILQCFTPDQPSMSVIEIQKRVGLSRPTLYRLLHTLASRELIDAEGDPQRFKLAHGVMKLSHVWLNGLDVVATARPIVESLRDQTGETAALFKLQDDLSICILEFASRHVLSISRGVGHSLKIAQGSTGKAMLAFLEPQRQAEIPVGHAGQCPAETAGRPSEGRQASTAMPPAAVKSSLARWRFPRPTSIIAAAWSAPLGCTVRKPASTTARSRNIPRWCAKPAAKYRPCLDSSKSG